MPDHGVPKDLGDEADDRAVEFLIRHAPDGDERHDRGEGLKGEADVHRLPSLSVEERNRYSCGNTSVGGYKPHGRRSTVSNQTKCPSTKTGRHANQGFQSLQNKGSNCWRRHKFIFITRLPVQEGREVVAK